MPVYPSIAERVALRGNAAPGVFLDLMGGTAFRTAMLALELGIFEQLAVSSMSATEISASTGCSQEVMERLLKYLVATKYIDQQSDNLYKNTAMTAKWLLKNATGSVALFLSLWNRLLTQYWDRDFAASVRHGKPLLPFGEWLSRQPDGWQTFNAAMKAMARAPAREVAERVKLPAGVRKLLDLGGNHGLYSEAFCKKYSQLEATVFDLPAALDCNLAAYQGRIKSLPGDVRSDHFGSDYDVVLLSNLLHYFDASTCKGILLRACEALKEGGLIIINEQFAGSARMPATNAFIRMVSLHYMLVLGSDAHPFTEVSSWVQASSCSHVKKLSLKSAPGQHLLIARRDAFVNVKRGEV